MYMRIALAALAAAFSLAAGLATATTIALPLRTIDLAAPARGY